AGTASAGWLGSARAQNERGTNTAITAESTTPKTRNGEACTRTETKTVVQVCHRAPETSPSSGPRNTISRISRPVRSSNDPIRAFFAPPVAVAAPPGATVAGAGPSVAG